MELFLLLYFWFCAKRQFVFLWPTLSHVRLAISVLIMAVARAKVITGRSCVLAFFKSRFSSPFSRRLVRPFAVLGLFTRLVGLVRLSIPQSV